MMCMPLNRGLTRKERRSWKQSRVFEFCTYKGTCKLLTRAEAYCKVPQRGGRCFLMSEVPLYRGSRLKKCPPPDDPPGTRHRPTVEP